MPWFVSVLLNVFFPLLVVAVYCHRKVEGILISLFPWPKEQVRWTLVALFGYLNILPVAAFGAFLIGDRPALAAFNGENRWIDLFLSYPFWIGLVVFVQLAIVFLGTDILRWVLFPWYRKHKDRWLAHQRRISAGFLVLVPVVTLTVVVLNTWTVQVRERTVPLPAGLDSLDGVRIALIADLQGDGRTTERVLRNFVETVNASEPDLILSAGDIVTSGETYIASTAAVMGGLRAPLGKIAVLGDHDFFSNRGAVVEELTQQGFLIVDDTTHFVIIRGTRLGISGITHTYRRRPLPERVDAILGQNTAPFRIVLVHQPNENLVAQSANQGIDLFLAGHTHGGGVAFGFPGLGYIAPASFESRYVSGFYTVGDMLVVVSNGLGFTLSPIRYNAPADMVLLTLKAVTR